MPRAAEGKGLLAVQGLRSCLDVRIGERVHDIGRHGDLDAADSIDYCCQGLEVHLCVVGDIDAGIFLDDLDRIARAAQGIGCVDLLHAIVAHVHHRVAGDGDKRDLHVLRVDPYQDDRVGTEVRRIVAPFIGALLALVHAEQQHVERLRDLLRAGELRLELGRDVCLDLAVDIVVVLRKRDACNGNDCHHTDEDRAENEMLLLRGPLCHVVARTVIARQGTGCRFQLPSVSVCQKKSPL